MTETFRLFCPTCMILQVPIDVNGQLICHVCKQSLHDDAEGHDRRLDEQSETQDSE